MDTIIFRFINNLAGKNNALDMIMIFFAEYFVFILALIMIILWFVKKNKKNREMLFTAFSAFVLGEVLNRVAGLLVFHIQPFATLSEVNQLIEKGIDNSFPSNHATLAFSVLTTYFLYNKNYKGLIALLIAIVVSISRIYVGVHYPIDILVGALIGTFSAYICVKYISEFPIVKKLFNDK